MSPIETKVSVTTQSASLTASSGSSEAATRAPFAFAQRRRSAGGASSGISAANTLRAYFLILAFVSIGLEFRVTKLLAEGWRPVVVFGSATVFNLAVALLIASVVFAGFET